ncbi:hypothetical protein D3C83_68480 [compost metagenome]
MKESLVVATRGVEVLNQVDQAGPVELDELRLDVAPGGTDFLLDWRHETQKAGRQRLHATPATGYRIAFRLRIPAIQAASPSRPSSVLPRVP